MQVKTSKLNSPALDWAVAKCEEPSGRDNAKTWLRDYLIGFSTRYSSVWSQGGQIIDREKIGVYPSQSISGAWAARPDYKTYPNQEHIYGETALIAAMRCYVASKLGETVDIPKELI